MSRSGTNENSATSSCSSRRWVLVRTTDEVPIAELRCSLDDAAADEVRVGIGEVGGDREQPADRHRLLLEDLAGHLVAALAEPAHLPWPPRRSARRPAGDRGTGSASTAAGCARCRSATRRSRRRRRTRSCSAASADRRRADRPSGCARGRARRPCPPRRGRRRPTRSRRRRARCRRSPRPTSAAARSSPKYA